MVTVVHVMPDDLHGECFHLPLTLVRFPIELVAPEGFRPDDLSTWPRLEGRLEYVNGRILYMPPCGDRQQEACIDLATVLGAWVHSHPEFVAGGNEAGMKLGGDVRAADGAIWRRADLGPHTGGVRRVAPLLAVEVAGREEGEPQLRAKARWYLDAGIATIWLILPQAREVVVVTAQGESRHGRGARLPEPTGLPDLTPEVADFFVQIDRGG
ncbi:MAG TPA: Uma2 family endonuclease [Polyangia bacterium]|jgi:Uma2 family endonuclease